VASLGQAFAHRRAAACLQAEYRPMPGIGWEELKDLVPLFSPATSRNALAR
jgi:hypothetical protein